jgi:hypothetical protein
MSTREVMFAAVLAVAAVAVVYGVTGFSPEAAWIIGGVLLAGWAWLILGDVE